MASDVGIITLGILGTRVDFYTVGKNDSELPRIEGKGDLDDYVPLHSIPQLGSVIQVKQGSEIEKLTLEGWQKNIATEAQAGKYVALRRDIVKITTKVPDRRRGRYVIRDREVLRFTRRLLAYKLGTCGEINSRLRFAIDSERPFPIRERIIL